MKRQYELGTGLNEYKEGILNPIKVKSQNTTFSVGFMPARKDFKAMIAQGEKGRMLKQLVKPLKHH